MINKYRYNTPYRTPMLLGNVSFDATMERSQTYSADVPTYPVEKGFKISDAVLKNPLEISLKAVISEMPLTFGYSYGAYGWYRSVEQVINELKQIYFAAEPVTLYTNFGNYPSLVIQSMTIPETTEMVNAVEVSITLKQVSITGNYDIETIATKDFGGPSKNDAGRVPTYTPEGLAIHGKFDPLAGMTDIDYSAWGDFSGNKTGNAMVDFGMTDIDYSYGAKSLWVFNDKVYSATQTEEDIIWSWMWSAGYADRYYDLYGYGKREGGGH